MKDVNCMEMYFKDIEKISLLTREEEIELAKKVSQGDGKAKEKMINANLRLVIHMAKNYLGRGISLEDLVGYGNQGLIIAVDRYELDRGTKVSSYAGFWIKQVMLKAIADFSRTIRIPTSKGIDLDRIERMSVELCKEKNYTPSIEEIAEKTGISVEKIDYLCQISKKPASLDKEVGKNGGGKNKVFGDYIESGIVGPEEEFLGIELKKEIERVFAELNLPERTQRIIEDRFGLKIGRRLTLEEVGKKYGLTRERIRQIEKKTLGRFRGIKPSERLATYLYE